MSLTFEFELGRDRVYDERLTCSKVGGTLGVGSQQKRPSPG